MGAVKLELIRWAPPRLTLSSRTDPCPGSQGSTSLSLTCSNTQIACVRAYGELVMRGRMAALRGLGKEAEASGRRRQRQAACSPSGAQIRRPNTWLYIIQYWFASLSLSQELNLFSSALDHQGHPFSGIITRVSCRRFFYPRLCQPGRQIYRMPSPRALYLGHPLLRVCTRTSCRQFFYPRPASPGER